MPSIIRNGKVVADNWSPAELADGAPAAFAAGDLLVPLSTWLAHRDALLARSGRLGLRLEGNDDPAAIADDLTQFDLIAVNFPQFSDGRGNSLGRLLRERYGFRGELRAVGDVPRDNLFFLLRCGFDAFAVSGPQDEASLAAAIGSLADFSEAYQASVERPQSLFRRRLAGAEAA